MPLSPLPMSGSCRCGKVVFRVTGAPICTAACHCRGCQKMAASAYSLTMMVPLDGFEVTRGEPVIGGMKAPELQHNFCPDCMTWMFTRLAGAPFVNVRPTMLDDATWFRPFIETWTSTRLPFAETGAVRSFGEFPAMEEIEGVLKDYAQWAASGGSG